MRAGQIWLDAVGQKRTAAANTVPDSAPRSAEPEDDVVTHVHAARKSPIKLAAPQGQKRTGQRYPVPGKRTVFPPATEMECPGHTNRNEFINHCLSWCHPVPSALGPRVCGVRFKDHS